MTVAAVIVVRSRSGVTRDAVRAPLIRPVNKVAIATVIIVGVDVVTVVMGSVVVVGSVAVGRAVQKSFGGFRAVFRIVSGARERVIGCVRFGAAERVARKVGGGTWKVACGLSRAVPLALFCEYAINGRISSAVEMSF